MRKRTRYEEAWRKTPAPPPQAAPEVKPPDKPVVEVRAGYKDADGAWHPSPTSKSYAKHATECASCAEESAKLGVKV